jgi:gliding motility-associated-like protein
MKHIILRKLFVAALFFAAFLLSLHAVAQPVGVHQYYDPLPVRTSNVIATKNGEIISVFLLQRSAPPAATYSTVIQRTDNGLNLRWSKLLANFALSAIIEGANGDLIFSGTETGSGRNIASIIRTTGSGSLVWRYDATTTAPLGGSGFPGAEQRLAQTKSGKLYFHFLGSSRITNEYTTVCLKGDGGHLWTRQFAYPSGFVFTDMTSSFEDNILLSGTLSSSGSAIALVDSTGKWVFTRLIGAGSRLNISQILKDSARQRYLFCGDFTDRFNATKAMVGKVGADLTIPTDLTATVTAPVFFKCLESPKTYGIDAEGSVFCLYANRNGITSNRKIYDGPTANIQVPMVKFDSGLNVLWRKHYLLPSRRDLITHLASTPQLLLMNDKLIAGLETINDIPRGAQNVTTAWLHITYTEGSVDACSVTPEPFSFQRTSFTAADQRLNFVSTAANTLTSSSTLSISDYALSLGSGCTTRRWPKGIFSYSPAGNTGGSPPVVCKGAVLSFVDSSAGGPETWQWIFPAEADLSAADSSCFPHISNVAFQQTGTFPIMLVVQNAYGIDTLIKYIIVDDGGKRPDLGPDKSICPGDIVMLSYIDSPLSTHVFTQPGTSFTSTADTIYITTPGTYICTVTTPCGTQSDTLVIKPAARPTADFVASATCGNLTVSFSDQSLDNGNAPLAYYWQFLDHNNIVLGTSSQQAPLFTYPAFDTVKARLVVTGPLGCTTPDTVEKKFLLRQKLAASFTFTEQCGSLQASFTGVATVMADTVSAYNWSFGDGGSASGVSSTMSYNYSKLGTYTAQLVVSTKGGCTSDPVRQTVTIRAKPVAHFTYRNDACEGKPFTLADSSIAPGTFITGYWWLQLSSGQSFTTPVVQPVISQAGAAVFLYAVTSAQGCTSDTVQKTIIVESIPIAAITAGDGCQGQTLSFTSNATTIVGSIAKHQWTVSNGLTSSQQAPSFVFPAAGAYTVSYRVESGNGCTSNEAIKAINIFPLPQPVFTTSKACLDVPVDLINSTPSATGFTWEWRLNNSVFSTDANPSYKFASGGTYNVSLQSTTADGCKAAHTKTIVVDDLSLQVAASQNPVVTGFPVMLTTTATTTYSIIAWQPAAFFTQQDSRLQHFISDSSFSVLVIGQSPGGCRDTATLSLDVLPVVDIYVPSAFTPNNDGKNDVLRVMGSVAEMNFIVFNRWGGVVFSSRSKSDGWNGTLKGMPLATGTYVYLLNARSISGKAVEKKGTVTLIR